MGETIKGYRTRYIITHKRQSEVNDSLFSCAGECLDDRYGGVCKILAVFLDDDAASRNGENEQLRARLLAPHAREKTPAPLHYRYTPASFIYTM